MLAIGNLINNTVVTEAISGPAKSNFKITINEGNLVAIPAEGVNKEVQFTVAGFTPETIVKPIPCEGYTVRITAYDNTTGKGTVQFSRKTGTPSANTEFMLIADNGKGKSTLASERVLDAYIGPASGLADTATNHVTNRAKPVWIITDGDTILTNNAIKTALVAIYEADNTARRQLELPNATGIGDGAFYYCRALASVSLPNATSIGADAFSSCYGLSSVSLPAVTSIGAEAFYSCSKLTSVSLPSATSIGAEAFQGCSFLTSVTLPAATIIGAVAFQGCSFLTSVSLPAATSIGEWAFASCSALSSVSLPAANTIGLGAFQSCGGLTSVSFGSHITSWGVNVFYTNGNEFTQNITLTFKTEQKTFQGSDGSGWSITETDLIASPTNKVFVGKTFKEIILK